MTEHDKLLEAVAVKVEAIWRDGISVGYQRNSRPSTFLLFSDRELCEHRAYWQGRAREILDMTESEGRDDDRTGT